MLLLITYICFFAGLQKAEIRVIIFQVLVVLHTKAVPRSVLEQTCFVFCMRHGRQSNFLNCADIRVHRHYYDFTVEWLVAAVSAFHQEQQLACRKGIVYSGIEFLQVGRY